jgi:histone acetyltransferase (RNA polymerase elongator complex component)
MPFFTFAHPERPRPKNRIFPAFLAFMGCPSRCVFCAQELQSGKKYRPLAVVLKELATDLETAAAMANPPEELAFYGGTFTLLPFEDQLACLSFAAQYKKAGLITKVRASTRPDAVPPKLLTTLAEAGLDMLELGVQSFSDAALSTSVRGYDGFAALQGCEAVKKSGLSLGIQLMPGMPGMDADAFAADWQQALDLKPQALRLYPCLVLAGTQLAAMHAAGEFTPWGLEKTIPLLANALYASWRAGVPVIRMGLAPQDGLDGGDIITGPCHPALGSMVRGLALHRYITETAGHIAPLKALHAPKSVQGEFWGYKGSLVSEYAALGLTNAVSFDGETAFTVEY